MMSKKKRADITALYETHRKPNVVPESLAQLPECSLITFTLFSCVKKTFEVLASFRLSGCFQQDKLVLLPTDQFLQV